MSRKCVKCGEPVSVAVWKRALSWPMMILGIVFAVPSVGITLVATIYGVFLRVPSCENCARRSARTT